MRKFCRLRWWDRYDFKLRSVSGACLVLALIGLPVKPAVAIMYDGVHFDGGGISAIPFRRPAPTCVMYPPGYNIDPIPYQPVCENDVPGGIQPRHFQATVVAALANIERSTRGSGTSTNGASLTELKDTLRQIQTEHQRMVAETTPALQVHPSLHSQTYPEFLEDLKEVRPQTPSRTLMTRFKGFCSKVGKVLRWVPWVSAPVDVSDHLGRLEGCRGEFNTCLSRCTHPDAEARRICLTACQDLHYWCGIGSLGRGVQDVLDPGFNLFWSAEYWWPKPNTPAPGGSNLPPCPGQVAE
jgi:hypothetical protein